MAYEKQLAKADQSGKTSFSRSFRAFLLRGIAGVANSRREEPRSARFSRAKLQPKSVLFPAGAVWTRIRLECRPNADRAFGYVGVGKASK